MGPNPIDMYVGQRMRMRRILLNMSQQALATKLGLTFQQIQKYEKGANRMGASRLYQVSQALGVPMLFFFEDLPGARSPADNGAVPRYLIEFMQTTGRIRNKDLRMYLVRLIEIIADSQPRTPEKTKRKKSS